ncbi:MAG: T9SS type A sorting domain-containing protein [Bacteroidales bacterium]|nr:T9SS type A sorting domain-containing protein [Bacteroidales bacterium]
MFKKLALIFSCLLVCGISVTVSAQQQVVANAGGEGSAAGINLQWTLGECVTKTSETIAETQLTQGFQQPSYEVETIIEDPTLSFALEVFPVPASDFLTIRAGAGGLPGLLAVVYDLNGKIIIQQDLYAGENQIDMKPFPAAQYVLNITDSNGKLLKSIKIVKK